MTVRTRAQLNADANSALPDNVAGEISPADVRQRIKDLADSARLAEDLGDAAGKDVGSGANDVAAGNHGHGAATSGDPGFMAAADKQKLDGIEAGAEVNAVSSVAGKTGVVTLAKGDVGLGNVDNTSDADKPISTATQTALNGKAGTGVATTSANGLMSSGDKSKLDGITAGATANTGTVTSVSATVPTGLSVSGSPITSSGTLAITYAAGYQGYTTAEANKLNGIEASADVTDAGNVGSSIHGASAKTTPVDADTVALIDSAASNALKKLSWSNIKATLKTYFDAIYAAASHTHSDATTSVAGFMSSGDKTKLNGIASGATANTGTVTSVTASVPTGFAISGGPITSSGTLAITYSSGYQGYTTAEASKLSGIDAGAQVNAVTSVAGKTGAVTLAKGDVGLGNVDNTSDANKPVSTATQTALNGKANLAGGNDFTGPQRVGFTPHSIGAAAITLDLAANNGFTITMSGNPTISNPNNIGAAVGQEITLVFRGLFQPAFGSYWKFPDGEVPDFDGSLNIVSGIVISSTEIAAFAGVGLGDI